MDTIPEVGMGICLESYTYLLIEWEVRHVEVTRYLGDHGPEAHDATSVVQDSIRCEFVFLYVHVSAKEDKRRLGPEWLCSLTSVPQGISRHSPSGTQNVNILVSVTYYRSLDPDAKFDQRVRVIFRRLRSRQGPTLRNRPANTIEAQKKLDSITITNF